MSRAPIVTRNLALADCSQAGDVVVVIDVLRAFSTEAVAFEQGVTEIITVGTVEDALDWKQRDPSALVMGEVNGYRVPGFDLWNSPAELIDNDVSGRRLIHRSSAGTQGVLCARNAKVILAASFLVASATARYLLKAGVEQVDFIITGHGAGRDGEEDAACADFIAAILNGAVPDRDEAVRRVKTSDTGRRFLTEQPAEVWLRDLELCLEFDRCDFAMRVYPTEAGLIARKVEPGA